MAGGADSGGTSSTHIDGTSGGVVGTLNGGTTSGGVIGTLSGGTTGATQTNTGGTLATTSAGTGAMPIGGSLATFNSGTSGTHSAGGSAIGGTSATSAGGTSNSGGMSNSGGSSAGGSSASNVISCAAQPSCQAESCCKVISVPAGSYTRGVSPTSSVTLHAVYIDKYEVTVGRFRAFLANYDAWRAASHPSAGEGAYANPTIAQSGWDLAWNTELPASASTFADATHLASCGARSTWTATAGTGTPNPENYPINCISWYEAFAFCIWDGGRLPTEAEWHYVAVGGTEDRTYPWGNSPNTDPLPANYYYNHDSPFTEVGSEPNGEGRWGHDDLAGSMSEWCLDWYAADYPSTCNDCANLASGTDRANRGGTWLNVATALQGANRGYAAPFGRLSFTGVRCARNGP